MDSNRVKRPRLPAGRLPRLAAVYVPLLLAAAAAAAAERLDATALTRDLGDPRDPGNLKLAVVLPEGMVRDGIAARDFDVYVYPAHLGEAEGTSPRYLAEGLYLWRSGANVFLDARRVPLQETDCTAAVKVVFRPGGTAEAEGVVEEAVVYATQLVDVILAVDISSSMNHTDPRRRRVAAASSFIEIARRGGGIGRVGLVIFNARARLVTPLSPLAEAETLLEALQRIGADGMTSLDAPLRMGMEALTDGEVSQRPVVILLTDGRNEGSRYRDTHLELAERGIRIFTVGLTELADHELLKEMADATGGLYFRAPADEDLPEIYARLAAELGKRRLLQSETLSSARGEMRAPVDATVKKLVALADGGARVRIFRPEDGETPAGGGMSAAHLIDPEPGLRAFAWENAEPGVSVMSLFGDTRFFLDAFPPLLRGSRLALGATLADGARPLAGAKVWTLPVPGVVDDPVAMFDDGLHGDGGDGDGVYGAIIDFRGDGVESFDMTFRASGAAWSDGDFVRQASSPSRRFRAPPAGTAKLEGDLDFGVLFPGETGNALARVNLEAGGPRELDFGLDWSSVANGWPDMRSRVAVRPGRRDFQLEMTIPENALPGDYAGRFFVSDGDGLSDDGVARVRVGSVRFERSSGVDLGTIPPGTFQAGRIRIPYNADKDADFRFEFDGDDGLRVSSGATLLSGGEGEIDMEAVVTVPMGKPEGEYSGRVRIFAGPGVAEIPLRWRVRSYSAAGPGEIAPVKGVPALPELPDPGEMTALAEPPPLDPLLFPPAEPDREAIDSGAAPSPWDRAAEAIRDEPATSPVPLLPDSGDYEFPRAGESERSSGGGFWSAWWLYLFALLLLLMLLLLLIAYILYRLGKSELARLLLVSGLANLLLLAAFIALLGASSGASRESPQTVTVNLIADDYQPASEYYSDLEKEMLTAPAAAASMSPTASGDAAAFEATAPDGQQSPSGGLASERPAETAADGLESPSEARLIMASNPAAMPMENTTPEPMNRRERERRTDRSDTPESKLDVPDIDSPSAGAEAGERAEIAGIDEAMLDMEADAATARPEWSDGARVARAAAAAESLLPAENAGMEAVGMEMAARSMNPLDRRRAMRDAPDMYPEPRVEIADPVRDNEDVARPDALDDGKGRQEVEEIRSKQLFMNVRSAGSRPETAANPAASSLNRDINSQAPGSASGDGSALSFAHADPRPQRGGGHAGTARAAPAGNLPGGLLNDSADNRGRGAGAENAANGGDVGEKRFAADAPGGGGTPGGDGGSGSSSSTSNGGDFTPSRLGGGESGGETGGGDNGDRVDFASVPSSGGDGRGPRRIAGRGLEGDQPQGFGEPPGSPSGGAGQRGDARQDAAGGRRGPGGVDEGRFDSLPDVGGGVGLARRGGAASAGIGGSALGDGGPVSGLGAVSLPRDDGSWFIERRREPRRHVTTASSSLEMDGLLIVVGDFARLPDPAAENIFSALANRIGGGMAVEERRLSPDDANLSDALLAVLSPEAARGWSNDDIARVGAYLAGGGHVWMDNPPRDGADDVMRRLAEAAGGEYGPLPSSHPLSEHDKVDAIVIGDKVAAVSTAQDWRNAWRYGEAGNGPAMRFLVRGLNYFLSGNAESGIVLASDEPAGDPYVEPRSEGIPDSLSGGGAPEGRIWDSFEPAAVDAWRMPAWSDPGEISAASDGQGGRALKLDLAAAVKGRVAAYRVLDPRQDFSRVERLALDVYHDGDGEAAVSLVLTISAAGGWTDYETPPRRLNPGWNRVEFDLKGTFRALAGGGAFAPAPAGVDGTGRVGFFLYRNGSSPAIAMFRNIRLHERQEQ